MSKDGFTDEVVRVIKSIPRGKVMTYGQVAAAAGSPRGARQVVRILHTQSRKHSLPWHRVVGSAGRGKAKISIGDAYGSAEQAALLVAEGVEVRDDMTIPLSKYGIPR